MKKLMWIVTCLDLIATAVVIQFLPDRVPMHFDAAGNVTRWGSRFENLLIPLILLASVIGWEIYCRILEKRAAEKDSVGDNKEAVSIRNNIKRINAVGLGLPFLVIILQVAVFIQEWKITENDLSSATFDISKITTLAMGALLIFLGNITTKTRRNGAIGVRMTWSMYNDVTWAKCNRFGGIALMIAGVLTIIESLILNNGFVTSMVMLTIILLATVVVGIYSRGVYAKEVAKDGGKKH